MTALTDPAESKLFPAGWPRPKHAGRPVPYVTDVSWIGHVRWAQMNTGRVIACVLGFGCQVCGEPCLDGDLHVVVNTEHLTRHESALDAALIAQSGGPLHRRCARLSAAACPHLRQAVPAGTVTLVAVTRAALEPWYRTSAARGESEPWSYTICGAYWVVETWA